MTLEYFEEINRRFRKHMGLNVQKPGHPLLSGVIDFDADIKGKKVLDIATGSGLHTVEFAAAGADVTGIDLTPFAVVQTKKNLEVRGFSAEVREMDAQHMDLPDNSFDFVNAWGCLMHMPDTEKAMREIHRVLKPGGRTFAYMYNRSSWPFWFNIILLRGILLAGLVRYKGNITRLTSRYSDGAATGGNMLTKFYTPKQVERMFRAAGFSNVKALPLDLGYEADHWPMNSFPVFKFLPKSVKAWMGKRWGYGLIVYAQK
ncbi:methyltransferase domain-containing protein [Patescibacteria group bacterium]|nr:methyltransferase domain-containing protein [Patescibacteria group bacterium]